MTIELITRSEYERLLEIQEKYPNLTYFNTGFDTPDMSKWSEEDREVHAEISELLKTHIVGFSEFNHFKKRANGRIDIRLQYNYSADDPRNDVNFTGVGYIEVDELLNGFKEKA